MLRAYIAGPLRAQSPFQIRQNVEAARAQAELIWSLGFAVFCPHLNTEGMVGMLKDEELFIEGDLAWLKCANVVVLLPGWGESIGAKREEEIAKAYSIRLLIFTEYKLPQWYDLETKKYLCLRDMRQIASESSFYHWYKRSSE